MGNAALAAELSTASTELTEGDVNTVGGSWRALVHESYEIEADGKTSKGCSIELEFMPNSLVDAEQIMLVQTCRAMVVEPDTDAAAAPYFLEEAERERRATTASDGEVGWHIDSGEGDVSPVYGVDTYQEGAPLTHQGDDGRTNKRPGRCTMSAAGGTSTVAREPAYLKDGPKLSWTEGKSYTMSFETAALCTAGAQEGAWYGSVSWGCAVDAKGAITLDELDVCEQGGPSASFTAASSRWNEDMAMVSPDHDPSLSESTPRATTDLPLDGRTIDPTDPSLQARGMKLEFVELSRDIAELKTARINFVKGEEGRQTKKGMSDADWVQLLEERFDAPVRSLEAEVVALRARKAAAAQD